MLDARKFLGNFLSATGMRAIVAVTSFCCFVVLARYWGSGELGQFATVFAFFVMLLQAPLLGLHVPLIRDLAREPESVVTIGPNAAVLATTAGVLLGIGLGATGHLYAASMRPSFWLVGVALAASGPAVVAESVLIAQGRLARVAAINIAESLARTGVWTILIVAGFRLTALFAALAVVRILALGAYYGPDELRPLLRVRRCRWHVLVGLMRITPTFLGILILAAALTRLDFIMLSAFGTLDDVGQYAAAYKLYETAVMVPSVLTLALFPEFARVSAASEGQRGALLQQFVRVVLTIGLPCAVALATVATPLMLLIYGDGFARAAAVLVILAIGPVLVAVDQAFTMALLADGHERLDLRVLACSCAFYLFALWSLIQTMGVAGAGLATTSTAVVQVGVRYRYLRRKLQVESLTAVVTGPSVAALSMACTIWVVSTVSSHVALASGAIVYVAVLALLRVVTRADLQWLRAALQRPEASS